MKWCLAPFIKGTVSAQLLRKCNALCLDLTQSHVTKIALNFINSVKKPALTLQMGIHETISNLL